MENKKTLVSCASLEENLKKALTELLMLHLLNQQECFIGELTEKLNQLSNGVLQLAFPYSAVYRLLREKYIQESDKRVAPDGRKRQYYRISQQGRDYYHHLFDTYHHFIVGIEAVLHYEEIE